MKKCILVYDDVTDILDICKTVFTKRNYRVEVKDHCDNIISDIEKLKPDIILMDLWIPAIGGEKAISLMKENTSFRHIPVILFSANNEIGEICKTTDAAGYIEKPFNINTLVNTIEDHIL